MKKAVVTILLILPFLLIYFISFTGRILSQYTYIAVERIAVLDSQGDEYKENSIIKIGKGESKGDKLRIKVYPEYASNKNISISGGGSICSIDKETHMITGLELGEATIIITSQDKTDVQFAITIKVAEDEIQAIHLSTDLGVGVPGVLNINKNRSKYVEHTIVPYTVPTNMRGLEWWSENPNIATVNRSGKITGINYGTTTIWVKSIQNPDIKNHFTVNVTSDLQKGIWWDKGDNDYIALTASDIVPNANYDLKLITLIKNLPIDLSAVSSGDIWYTLNGGDIAFIDDTLIDQGIIKFTKSNVMVSISVSYDDGVEVYSDSVNIWYR